MRTLLSISLLCMGLTLTAAAQVTPVSTDDIPQPKQMPSGKVVAPELGISYVLDEGWEEHAALRATQRDQDAMVRAYLPDEQKALYTSSYPSNSIVMGLNFYVSSNIDEYLLPEATVAEQFVHLETQADAIYAHFLHVRADRAERWYQRMFFERGWCAKSWNIVRWLGAHCQSDVHEMDGVESFGPSDPRMPFSSGTGFVYDNVTSPNAIPQRTYEFFVVQHGYGYHIKVELDVHNHEKHWPRLKAILDSIEFSEPTY